MSNDLFLPRELFQVPPEAGTPAQAAPVPSAVPAAQPAPAAPARPPGRRGAVQFTSGEAVAADLLQALGTAQGFVERRRKPRPAGPLKSR